MCKAIIRYVALFLLLLFTGIQLNAQSDTALADTAAQSNNQLDEDTTEKHIYDTSQHFFTTKEYYTEPFTTRKINQRLLSDSAVQHLKNTDDFWYIHAAEKIELRLKNDPAYRDSLLKAKSLAQLSDQNQKNFTQQQWFRILIWCIIIGVFLGGLLYFLLQNKISLFSKDSQKAKPASAGEEEHTDIFHLPYPELLKKAEQEQDYRSAVRLLYLQTLKLFSNKNIIQYQPDYTNLHYLQQLYKSRLYSEFFTVTRHYEYAWYGKFEISKTKFEIIKQGFLAVQNKAAV